jgi:copper oxidase (laccase) domain-containing protein
MTQDEIIEMWHAANGTKIKGEQYEVVEAFAKLVAQHEREACAEVCKKHAEVYALLEQNPHAFGTAKPAWAACIDNRDTILARGQA